MRTYLLKMLAGTKNLVITLCSIFASFIAPIQGLIFLAVMLCLADFLVKLYVVAKKEGFKAIESRKMGDTGLKMAFYCGLLVILQLTHNLFFLDFGRNILNVIFEPSTVDSIMQLNMAAVGAFLIIVREFKSIDENWESLSGWSFIKSVSDKFSWIFKFKNGSTTSEKNGDQ